MTGSGQISSQESFPEMFKFGDDAPNWLNRDHTDRGFTDYSTSFGLDLSVFAGQIVLDLGSGKTGKFAHEALAQGIEAHSINPNWQTPPPLRPDLAVAGKAEELPYAPDSFDFIVSLWGVPVYLPGTVKAYADTFASIQRVLKPNGWALLAPIARMTYKIPGFHEIIEQYFPGEYEFLDIKRLPKLLLYKNLQADKKAFLSAHKADMEASNLPSIW